MRIGSLEYEVTGDASSLRRVLADAVAEAKAAMAAIDGDDANIAIKGQTRDLERAAAKAQAIIDAIDGQTAEVELDLDADRFQRGIAAVQKDMSRSTLAITKHNSELANLRESYAKLFSERQKVGRQDLGRQTNRETLAMQRLDAALAHTGARIREMGGDTRDLNQDIDRNNFSLSSMLGRLSRMGRTRVNLGPISTSLRGFATGLAALSPLVIGLVGGASALVGAIGEGLVGAFGVGAGAAAGFGLALLPLLPSLKTLMDEAKTAPSVGGALAKMRDALTGGIRQPFFQGAHQAVKTLQADFPAFKREATGAFSAVSQGFQSWMHGLRSPEAQHIISNLIGNFTKDIGPAMTGLGSLATAFGRFVSIASGSGPGIARTFQGWAAGIERSTRSGTGFAQWVQNTVSQAKSLGSALTATGRLAVAFFGAGAKGGQDLLDSLTRSENRMTAWMHTVAGQRSLHTFFKDAVANTKGLFSALAPLVSTFVRLGNALAPVTTGALHAATFIANMVHAVAQLAPARVTLQGFGAALAGIFVISKASAAVGMIRGFAASLGLIAPEETAAAAATTANTAALEANTAAMAANAAAAGEVAAGATAEAAAMGEAAVAGEAAAAGGAAAEGSMLGLAGAMGPVTITLGAIVAGGFALNALFGGHTPTAFDKAARAIDGFNKADDAALNSIRDLHKQQKASVDSWQQANKLAKEGKTHTDSYTQSVRRGAQADLNASRDRQQHNQQVREAGTQLQNLRTQTNAASAELAKHAQSLDPMTGRASQAFQAEAQGVAVLRQQLALAQINFARLQAGAGRVGPQFAAAISKIQGLAGKGVATKLSVSGSSAVVQDIAKVSAGLKRLGQGQKAIKILADTGSAESKLQRLRGLLNQTQKTHKAKVSADVASGLHSVGQFLGLAKQTDKSHTTRVNAETSGAQSAIQAVLGIINSIPSVVTTVVNVVKNVVGGGNYQGGVEPGFAEGGRDAALMARAYAAANNRLGLDPKGGGRVQSPRYVVGEEPGRTEFVITDNPSYRRSNLEYLQEAAAALGQMIIPGYKKGWTSAKKKNKSGKGKLTAPAYDPEGPNLDDQTGPNSYYQQLEDLVSFDSGMVDLARRQLSLGGDPTATGPVKNAINQEIKDYGILRSQIVSLIGQGLTAGGGMNPQALMVPVPDVPKLGKKPTKAQKKKQAALQAKHDAAVEHNESIQGGFESLANELRSIDNLVIPNLQLDLVEIDQQAQAALTAQTLSFNTARQDLFRTFGSNVNSIIGTTFGGAIPSDSASTLNYNPAGTTVSGVSGSGVVSTSSEPASGQGGSSTTITNNFAAPPPDAFTWTQQQLFEVQAA